RLPLLLGDGLLGDLPRHVAVDGGKRLLDAIGGYVVQLHIEARKRTDMGNTRAHLSRSDHADFLNTLRHVSFAPPRPGSCCSALDLCEFSVEFGQRLIEI